MRNKDEAKKQAIRKATLKVVDQLGFAGIKMADLARTVGVSVSTLYVYYKSKEDLIQSLAIELMQEATVESQKSANKQLPFTVQLFELWNFWVLYSLDNILEVSFLEQLKHSPYYESVPDRVKEDKSKIGLDLFESGKREGLIKDLDNVILATAIGALLKATVSLISEKKMARTRENIDMMFSFAWDAIKK
jgi:AcrR family transcriptional regulator